MLPDDPCGTLSVNQSIPDEGPQQWQDTWNCYRPSYGINMYGLTPEEKLKASKTVIQNHLLQFPVLLMENVLKSVGVFTAVLKLLRTGKYVHTKCQNPVCVYPESEAIPADELSPSPIDAVYFYQAVLFNELTTYGGRVKDAAGQGGAVVVK